VIVTLEITEASKRLIARHTKAADQAGEALARGLEAAAVAGADKIREGLVRGDYDLVMQHPGSGLAASVFGWMIDASIPLAAVGVPSDAPAAKYARILEEGGTIRPRTARALAVPISDEAKREESPRAMAGLVMISRRMAGKPPLLARVLRGGRLQVHWVLLKSVTIRPRRWLSRGTQDALPEMTRVFEGVLSEYVGTW